MQFLRNIAACLMCIMVYSYKGDSPNSCEGRVCKCDETFVDCLQNKEFNPDYYNADQDEYCDDGYGHSPIMLVLRNVAVCLLCIFLYIDFDKVETRSVRNKRALWNLGYQLTYYFGPVRATALLDYGCFCGWYGRGTPVDGVDQCCKEHDECYDRVDDCWPKIWPYSYELQNGTVNCQNRPSSCKGRICMCDKVFVDCLHINTFYPDHHDVDQDELCQKR